METRQRRPHNQLKDAMRKYLTTLDGGHASISEIKAAIERMREMIQNIE